MAQWYHSGIEGYCKAAAQLMGLPNDHGGWGNFGNDLFGDGRFDDPIKASKTWTLSRFRKRGRSNRPVLFEESWLGKSGQDVEMLAIEQCAHNIADEAGDSMLLNACKSNYIAFATGFRDVVLPAIADGFRTERYHSADIARFSQNIDDLLGELAPSEPRAFRNFARTLVAGVVYGPDHIAVRSATGDATVNYSQRASSSLDAKAESYGDVDEATIRITQLFSDDVAFVGYSEVFDDSKVVFLGRSVEIQRYLAKCNPSFASEIGDRDPVFYPIANSHKRTSNEHGAIARLGDTWYYHDFSTNGTLIENEDAENSVHDGIAAISPGDRICLGLMQPKEGGGMRFRSSTTLLVSFNIDETSLM